MAMNLRLEPELETALRELAGVEGRSQQQLMRDAIRAYVGRSSRPFIPIEPAKTRPPKLPFRDDLPRLPLPEGVTSSLDLLNRPSRY